MLCHEKIRLLRAYANAADGFNGAVDDLKKIAAYNSYDELVALAEEARGKCEGARLALATHVDGHGC